MIKITIKLIMLFLIITKSLSVENPALPNTSEVITCFPDTSGYKVITVGPINRDFSNLQQAINSAQLGTIIRLDAGVAFNGGFVLPKKTSGTGWIIIISSRMDLLSPDEKRIDPKAPTGNNEFPDQKSAMPKIITTNLSGIPCFITEANAHHYRLAGLEVTVDNAVTKSYGLINLGDGSTAQNSLSLVPNHFVIDRCYIHGHTDASIMKYGVAMNCANAAIIDSYISDFHSIGYDAQAISGINGPGPFKIINNYLEASGENIMFGGAAAAIPGLIPSDIEVRQNHFYKPFSWRVGHPTYSGKHWTIKNLFELKTGVRVLLDGNILENSWADLPIGQSGYAILLTIRTEGGGSPQAEVSDITISNNIIRHCGAGISLSGRDDGSTGNRSKRIKIYNNLFEDINGSAYGDMNINGPNDGTFIKIGEPEDLIIDHNTIFQTGPITWAGKVMNGFVLTNNITNSLPSSVGYQGIYGPGFQQGNATIANYFPDITDANQRIHKNVFIGGDASKYSNYNTISRNYFPVNAAAVAFVDYSNGISDYHNYSLLNSSQYFNNASDGKDIGIDFAMLDSAMLTDRGCFINAEIKVTSVIISPNDVSLFIGDSLNLEVEIIPANAKNKNITYKSMNDSIAIVSNAGVIKTKAEGTTMIIVETEDGGFKDTCNVTVSEKVVKVTSIKLNRDEININQTDTFQLTYTIFPENAANKNVKWRSNDSLAARVSQSGLVTGLTAESISSIIVTTVDGNYSDTCRVIVGPLGIDDINLKNIFINPNPSEDYIEIKLSESSELPESYKIEIYNILGESVMLEQTPSSVEATNVYKIDISDLPVGIYFLKAGDNIYKFVKN